MANRVLKVKTDRNEQKLVTVRSTGEELLLCCVDRQMGVKSVKIFKRYKGEKIQNAFSFMHENKHYFPMVDGNCLKLEEGAQRSPASEGCWFERVSPGSGEHYILQSVVHPRPYLSLSDNTRELHCITLGLSEYDDQSVLVTDYKV